MAYKGGQRLTSLQWHQANGVQVCFRGHKGDQARQVSAIVRTQVDASWMRAGVGTDVRAVALMMELPECAPLSSCKCGDEVRVWRYTETPKTRHQVAAKTGEDSSEVGLHSLRIGGDTTLAAGGEVSRRVMWREGRCKSIMSFMVCNRFNQEDAGIVSRRLLETGNIGQR